MRRKISSRNGQAAEDQGQQGEQPVHQPPQLIRVARRIFGNNRDQCRVDIAADRQVVQIARDSDRDLERIDQPVFCPEKMGEQQFLHKAQDAAGNRPDGEQGGRLPKPCPVRVSTGYCDQRFFDRWKCRIMRRIDRRQRVIA